MRGSPCQTVGSKFTTSSIWPVCWWTPESLILLAGLEDDLVTAPDGSTAPWTSPGGIPLAVAAAVPYAGYTDVINVMAPNGRAGDNVFAPDGDRQRPAGIPELFLDAAVPNQIAANAMMVAPANPTAGTDAFFRVASQYLVGEPFAQNPALTDDGQQLVKWKSAYNQNDLIARAATRRHKVPFFFVYGWTDELVSPVEATSLIGKLKAADPSWPINLALADIGHTGQNKLTDWDPIHQRLQAFLDQYLRNRPGAAIPPVSARVTTCDTTFGAIVEANSVISMAMPSQNRCRPTRCGQLSRQVEETEPSAPDSPDCHPRHE